MEFPGAVEGAGPGALAVFGEGGGGARWLGPVISAGGEFFELGDGSVFDFRGDLGVEG